MISHSSLLLNEQHQYLLRELKESGCTLLQAYLANVRTLEYSDFRCVQNIHSNIPEIQYAAALAAWKFASCLRHERTQGLQTLNRTIPDFFTWPRIRECTPSLRDPLEFMTIIKAAGENFEFGDRMDHLLCLSRSEWIRIVGLRRPEMQVLENLFGREGLYPGMIVYSRTNAPIEHWHYLPDDWLRLIALWQKSDPDVMGDMYTLPEGSGDPRLWLGMHALPIRIDIVRTLTRKNRRRVIDVLSCTANTLQEQRIPKEYIPPLIEALCALADIEQVMHWRGSKFGPAPSPWIPPRTAARLSMNDRPPAG